MCSDQSQREREILSCQMELSGYGLGDWSWAAPQLQHDITLPSVHSREVICSELVLGVSVHLPTH